MSTRISVITVAYNSGATIADTLKSVAAQTHPDIEHIVVDGASRDRTLDLVREHGAHVSQLISEPDTGIYHAMNKGLALARGDWVGFLNADDMYANECVVAEIASAAISAVDGIYGDLQYVSARDPDKVIRHWRSGAYSRASLKLGWMPPHPTFYLRRSRQQDLGRFDTAFRIAADYDFMLRCLNRPDFRVAYIPKALVHMRIGGASNRSISALWKKSSEDLAALRKNQVGGITTLLCKNLRKLPQFMAR